jgi:acetyl esterase/lipase
MARRSGGRFLALLTVLALVVSGCGPEGSESTGSTPGTTPTSSTSTTSSSTSTTSPTTTALPSTTATSPNPGSTAPELPLRAGSDLLVPEGEGPFPAVVLVHGGAWVVGNPFSIEPLAIYLSENGFLTINATYQLSLQIPGFPIAVGDIACAVRYAASHPLSDGSVTVIGHSAGAHIASLVALNGDDYGDDCPHPGTGVPERFVGLAGPYDISRLGPIMVSFFGSAPDDDPETWDLGNPQLRVGDNPALKSLLIHGGADQVVPTNFSELFHTGLVDSGGDSELVLLDAVDHSGVRDPSVVGELLLDWLSGE